MKDDGLGHDDMRCPFRARSVQLALIVLLLALTAACGDSVKHPLDDSESRPATADDASAEAETTLDELGESSLSSVPFTASSWIPPSGCGVDPTVPEQGEVGTTVYRHYAELPADATPETLMAETTKRWEDAGHTVGRGSANMPDQVITRINGIGYSLVSTQPGVELRAFLPCY